MPQNIQRTLPALNIAFRCWPAHVISYNVDDKVISTGIGGESRMKYILAQLDVKARPVEGLIQ